MNYDMNKEKMEAIMAGEKALRSLNAAKTELEKASNWGLVDIFGGGLIVSLVKHGKMKNAKVYIEEAQYDLQCFSRELADVTAVSSIEIDAGGLLSSLDIFMDGFFSDLLVQDRISNAKKQVNEAIYRVKYMLDGLRR